MKEVFAVFQGGKWHEYEPSIALRSDPRITPHELHIAAAAFIAAKHQGYSETKAYSLSDAIVFKQLYTHLQYAREFEDEILGIAGK
jgi:hypothetical protein